MARIRLLRRFGRRAAHSVHHYRDSEAAHLVGLGYAEYVAESSTTARKPVDQDDDAAQDGRGEGAPPAGDGPTLAELQARAKDLGVPSYGTKAQIAERITEAEAKRAAN